jgi:hypothetical protein
MLPNEMNPRVFQVPPNVDETNALVFELNQVDKIIFNNLDSRGDFASIGAFDSMSFNGMNMANDIYVLNNGPFSGIKYKAVEIIIFDLGDGVESITVLNTTNAIHIMNLGGNNDNVNVESLSGPLLINGERGGDTVYVSSDDAKLDLIDALLTFDGGNDAGDALILNNTGDSQIDDVLIVTRLIVQVESMRSIFSEYDNVTNPVLPRESFLVNLQNATGGTFILSVDDSAFSGKKNVSIAYPTNSSIIEQHLTTLLLGGPHAKNCGMKKTSYCADPVKVIQLGGSNTFAIFFIGERLNAGVKLSFETDLLIDFFSEQYKNATNDILHLTSDVAYTNVDELRIYMGKQDIVANIRGTSAAETFIEFQNGDDKVFVSSDADETVATADYVDHLFGVLDYIEGNLHLECNKGRHRLLISDVFSSIAKGVGLHGPAILTNSSFENLASNLGNIYFSANAGNWYDGITIWLGTEGDELDIKSVQALAPNRTVTSVHSGNGTDTLNITVRASNHSLLVANGQGDDDLIDASNSSLPVILFGDGGNDTLHGGSSGDVLFGDYGEVLWFDKNGVVVARVGGGGYGDFTDGEVRQISQIRGIFPPMNINYLDSGNDIVYGNAGRDVIFGCGGEIDFLNGDEGSDLLFGDFGVVHLTSNASNGNLFGILSVDSVNCTFHGGGRNNIVGNAGNGKTRFSFLSLHLSHQVRNHQLTKYYLCINQRQTFSLAEEAAATIWRAMPEMIWPLGTVHLLPSLAVTSLKA